jgi:hypothetical protein
MSRNQPFDCAARAIYLFPKIQGHYLDSGRVRLYVCRQHLKDGAVRFPLAVARGIDGFDELQHGRTRVAEVIRKVAVGQQIERRTIRRWRPFDEDGVLLPQCMADA